jgi:hypothetical protein
LTADVQYAPDVRLVRGHLEAKGRREQKVALMMLLATLVLITVGCLVIGTLSDPPPRH